MFGMVKHNLIYLVSCLDIFAVSLIIPLFTQYLLSIGFSNTSVGLLSSVYSGVQFFASPIIGHMSDVYGSQYVLVISLLTCSICYPIMGVADSFIAIAVVRILMGAIKHTQLLCKSYIQESMDEKEHIKSFGKFSGFTSLGFIVGPIIGGYIIDLRDGFMYMCCVTGFIFGINAILAYCLSDVRELGKKKPIRANRNFIVSFKNIPWSVVWDLFFLKTVSVFAVVSFYSSFSLSVTSRFNVSSVLLGYSYSVQGIVRTVTAFSIQSVVKLFPSSFETLLKVKIAYFILIACYTALYFSNNFYVYLLFLMPLNVCLSFVRIINHEVLVERTKNYNSGIIIGAFNNVTAICRFILPLLTGYIVDMYGYDVVYIISIGSLLIGVLIINKYGSRSRVKAE